MKKRKKKKQKRIVKSIPGLLTPTKDLLHPKSRKVVWGMPKTIASEVLTYDMWRSLCGRYWIARTQPKYGFNPYYTWGTSELVQQHGGGAKYHDSFGAVKTQDYRPTEYKDVFRCLEKIRADFENKHQMTCEMDDSAFLTIAKDKGLDKLPKKIELKGMQVEETPDVFDKFGFKEGSDKAKFNASITGKWMSFIRLKRRSGVRSRIRRHLLRLIELGFVVCKNEKYRLSKKFR